MVLLLFSACAFQLLVLLGNHFLQNVENKSLCDGSLENVCQYLSCIFGSIVSSGSRLSMATDERSLFCHFQWHNLLFKKPLKLLYQFREIPLPYESLLRMLDTIENKIWMWQSSSRLWANYSCSSITLSLQAHINSPSQTLWPTYKYGANFVTPHNMAVWNRS